MIADVDMVGAAALMHRSKGRFQKAWRRLARDEGFPQPFVGAEKGGHPWWRVADIEAWKALKAAGATKIRPAVAGSPAQRRNAGTAEPEPANDPVARPILPGDLAAQLLAAAGG